MHDFPHTYKASARAHTDANEDVMLRSAGLPDLASAPPAEFGGPGDRWSPETLLVAAVADCFILTFRAIAGASKYVWTSLDCAVEGELDRVERVTQFTGFRVSASLVVPPGSDVERAERLLAKAEQNCLITSSLKAPAHLSAHVTIGE